MKIQKSNTVVITTEANGFVFSDSADFRNDGRAMDRVNSVFNDPADLAKHVEAWAKDRAAVNQHKA